MSVCLNIVSFLYKKIGAFFKNPSNSAKRGKKIFKKIILNRSHVVISYCTRQFLLRIFFRSQHY